MTSGEACETMVMQSLGTQMGFRFILETNGNKAKFVQKSGRNDIVSLHFRRIAPQQVAHDSSLSIWVQGQHRWKHSVAEAKAPLFSSRASKEG